MGDNFNEILNGCVEVAKDLSEDQTEQQMVELQEMTKDTSKLLKETAQKFRQTADTLDYLCKSCQKVRIGGTSVGIFGGILTLFGGAAIVMSGGAATPLLFGGAAFGFAGTGTNVAATVIKFFVDSNEIKKAEIDWKKISDKMKELETNIQARLSNPPFVEIFRFFRRGAFYSVVACKEKIAQTVAQATAREGAKAGAQLADDIAGAAAKAGAQAADDIAGAAAKAGAQAADDIAGAAAKTGAQAADDVAGASFKAGANGGAKLVGKVIILAGVVCLVLDVLDLRCTINDLVKEKGSHAATFLREKADKLDEIQKLFKVKGK